MFAFFLTIIFTPITCGMCHFLPVSATYRTKNAKNSPDNLRNVHFFTRFRNLSKSFLLILHAQNIMI